MRLQFSKLTGKIYSSGNDEIENFKDILIQFLGFNNCAYCFDDMGFEVRIDMKVKLKNKDKNVRVRLVKG